MGIKPDKTVHSRQSVPEKPGTSPFQSGRPGTSPKRSKVCAARLFKNSPDGCLAWRREEPASGCPLASAGTPAFLTIDRFLHQNHVYAKNIRLF